MQTSEIVNTDCLSLLHRLRAANKRPAMIFADPPDNIGLAYGDYKDRLSEESYLADLRYWCLACLATSDVVWLSVNAKWQAPLWRLLGEHACDREVRMIVWYFTFGQHRDSDCGNNYRPIFRIAPKNYKWNTQAIRIQSERQRLGDPRANPDGRVPGDVWGGPADVEGLCRVQGNNRERRAWHPTQHPEKLLDRIIRMSTRRGDLVVDPFMGTGTTLRAAVAAGRRCVTCDLSAEYCNRVAEELGIVFSL